MRLVLKYLLLLRCLLIAGQLVALAVLAFGLGGRVPWLPVLAVLAAMAAVTAASWTRVRAGGEVHRRDFALQLGVDLAGLTVLVYFTGGSVNPFISLFLLPIVFAAAAMPPGPTALVALAAVLCYTALMFFHAPVDPALHALGPALHLWGMWYGFVLSAACVAVFVARIADALRAREQALAEAREQALRAERTVALGALAAGAAHELGTPLATMAVLAGELVHELPQEAAAQHALATLRGELRRCKAILARLAADAGELPADEGSPAGVPEVLERIVADWQALRSDVRVELECRGPAPPPRVVVDRTMRQAIINILNNAADAAPEAVRVLGRWDAEALSIEVRDQGPGIAAAVLERLGREPVSTKGRRGMGMGLYLAHGVVERLGGRVEFDNAATGGAQVTLVLPLSPLRASGAAP